MTAQIRDTLLYSNKQIYLSAEPLSEYLAGMSPKPKLESINTACWRGYVAEWKLIGKSLFLSDLFIQTKPKESIGVGYIFPDQTEVFADWFSGEIRIPEGELLEYVHMGYESKFRKELILTFEKGRVIGHEIIENKVFGSNDYIGLGNDDSEFPF